MTLNPKMNPDLQQQQNSMLLVRQLELEKND
jgi:hypothetical protein